MGESYIRWLSDLSKNDTLLAGGKGANLGELFNNSFPVPQAFVITTDAFLFFLRETNLQKEIRGLLNRIDIDDTEGLQKYSAEIRELILSSKMPEVLESEILESYDHFNVDLNNLKDSPGALAILRSAREPVFVSIRSSTTIEDLKDASFAGQQDSFTNVKGNFDLIDRIKKVFASVFSARSIYYRRKKGFEDLVSVAVIVQRMVNAEKSGVIFSQNPVSGTNDILIEAVFGQGEGIVTGRIKPDQHILARDFEIVDEKISDKKLAVIRNASGQTKMIELSPEVSVKRVLRTHELKQLAEYAINIEEHYGIPQDIEFSIEDNEISILQTRPVTALAEKKEVQDIDGQILAEGFAASPGVTSGVVKIIKSSDDLSKIKEGDILVTSMTNSDMVITMQKVTAVITSEGGATAHAAIISREMGIPAVVGTQNALEVLQDGMEVTVDGSRGRIFSGIAENKSVEIFPVTDTKTKIKVVVDLPRFAQRAAQTKAEGIGLARLDSIIALSGKHPLFYENAGIIDVYEDLLKKNLKKIAEKFISKPIWVRLTDIKSDEYSNLEGAPENKEKNPILGNHGIRFLLQHQGLLRAELRAVKSMADLGHKFGILLPQVVDVNEVKAAKKIFENEGCTNKVQFGVMIETPAASIMIKDICEEGVDFISIGINDLTQYTLAIDKCNNDVQYIYNELNWAILKQISRVIRECKKNGVLSSICGQATSDPEMIRFLVKQGIDSVTVCSDIACEISELIKGMENGMGRKEIKAREGENTRQGGGKREEVENEEAEVKVSNGSSIVIDDQTKKNRVHEGGEVLKEGETREFHHKDERSDENVGHKKHQHGDWHEKKGHHGKNKHRKHGHNNRVRDQENSNNSGGQKHGDGNGMEDNNRNDYNMKQQNGEEKEGAKSVDHENQKEHVDINKNAWGENMDKEKLSEPTSEGVRNSGEEESVLNRNQENERPNEEPLLSEEEMKNKQTQDIFN
jgi:pyruvate, water dikinase